MLLSKMGELKDLLSSVSISLAQVFFNVIIVLCFNIPFVVSIMRSGDLVQGMLLSAANVLVVVTSVIFLDNDTCKKIRSSAFSIALLVMEILLFVIILLYTIVLLWRVALS